MMHQILLNLIDIHFIIYIYTYVFIYIYIFYIDYTPYDPLCIFWCRGCWHPIMGILGRWVHAKGQPTKLCRGQFVLQPRSKHRSVMPLAATARVGFPP